MPHERADGTLRGRKEQAVAQLYTSGTWIAKQGKEMDFIAAWRDFGSGLIGRLGSSTPGSFETRAIHGGS
jgi:hypothetical protein